MGYDFIPVQQPFQLLPRYRYNFIGHQTWQLEAGLFQPLLPQVEATAFPVEDLHFVTFAIAEHEQLLRKWILLECIFHQ